MSGGILLRKIDHSFTRKSKILLHPWGASHRCDVLPIVKHQKPGGVGILDKARQDAPAAHCSKNKNLHWIYRNKSP